MIISVIAALGRNRELGLDNKMLWRIKEDWKHFKGTTMGHTLLMGRKTFDSIGSPLPGRKTFILTRNKNLNQKSCEMIYSLEEGVELAKEQGETNLFIAGGAEIYSQALETLPVSQLILSFVDFKGDADAYFPSIDLSQWTETHRTLFKKEVNTPAWELKIFKRTNNANC